MNARNLIPPVVIAGIGVAIGAIAIADTTTRPAAPGDMKLPPGWTQEAMQACIAAGTPGKNHEFLTHGAGVWRGTCTMWMAPDTDPLPSHSNTTTVTPIMDGRYVRVEMEGEMPGMGPYKGLGVYGFDNVTQQFVSSWIDNHGTGIGTGIGALSSDRKVLTWKFTFNCPREKKAVTFREVETITGPDTKTLEMFNTDAKTGKEYKMMRIELTRERSATSDQQTANK